ncbi:hypothetical protein [Staphylococcus phage PT1-4]
MKNTYKLESIYSTQKSFYGKAVVNVLDNGHKILTSYNTNVCELDENNNIIKIGYYSQTTARHINEFIMQHGYDKMTKKEIENY